MNIPRRQLPSYELVPEPELLFHPSRPEDVDIHPLRGLLEFGPYSRKLPLLIPDPIRLAVLCPEDKFSSVRELVDQLEVSHRPRERSSYLVNFVKFSRIFGVNLDFPRSPKDQRVCLLSYEEIGTALKSDTPHEPFAELVLSAVRRLSQVRSQFDVLLLYLPDEFSLGFTSPTADELSDFDLHDSVKALSSLAQIPVQMLNDDPTTYFCRCSVAWRLALAIYAKAGGIPWKLSGFDDRHAYVGLSYCLRKAPEHRFVTCCSQIFDSQGTNLKFLLYETNNGRYEGDNPYLPRQDMYRVMARTLSLYQHQKGRPPSRLIVHKTTQFTNDEIEGCIDALSSVDDVELLTLTENTAWQGLKFDWPQSRGSRRRQMQPTSFPLERGTILPLDGFEFLLWTQGNCSKLASGNFFKEGKGIPRPLRVTRHMGQRGFYESGREILGLTKMNWNNDSLYDRLPVTNSYAKVLARVVKRLGSFSHTPYEFRYFM